YSALVRTGPAETPNAFARYPPGSAAGVAADGAGAAYVTGDVDSASNFRATTGAFQTTNGGGQGAILVKLAGPTGTLALASSATAVVAGSPVTLTATVSGVSLSGNIVFTDVPAVIWSAVLSVSKALFTIA